MKFKISTLPKLLTTTKIKILKGLTTDTAIYYQPNQTIKSFFFELYFPSSLRKVSDHSELLALPIIANNCKKR